MNEKVTKEEFKQLVNQEMQNYITEGNPNAFASIANSLQRLNYSAVIGALRAMDNMQLLNLCEDLDDSTVLVRLGNAIETYFEKVDLSIVPHGKSDHVSDAARYLGGNDEADLKVADDLQRYNDIKSEQEGR